MFSPERYLKYAACVIPLAIFSILLRLTDLGAYPDKIPIEDWDMDLLEYHTVAVNFALYNRFPVMGFLGDEPDYRLYYIHPDSISAHYNHAVALSKSLGPIVFLRKPPLYPLLLGLIYKWFGIDARCIHAFHLLLLSCIGGLLPFAGWRLGGWYGLACGLPAGIIFIACKMPSALKIDPELLLSFIVFIIFAITVKLEQKAVSRVYLLAGALFCFAVFARGTIVFIPIFYTLHLLFQRKFSGALMVATGFFLVLLPWTAYINIVRVNSVEERLAWNSRNLEALEQIGNLSDYSIPVNERMNDTIIEFVLRDEYATYASANHFTVISNQQAGDQILGMHNEFCTDGWWHPEWKFAKNSWYLSNAVAIERPVIKMLFFYKEHPDLLFSIALAKLKNATDEGRFPFFWFSAAFFGLLTVQRKIPFRIPLLIHVFLALAVAYSSFQPITYFYLIICLSLFLSAMVLSGFSGIGRKVVLLPISSLNFILLVGIVFSGDPKFTRVIDFLTIFSTFWLPILFITELSSPVRWRRPQ